MMEQTQIVSPETPVNEPNLIDWWLDVERLLTISALLLGIVAILLALGGVFAFINVRHNARKVAESEAKEVAEVTAEKVANAYLQAELPRMLREYNELAMGAPGDQHAADAAAAQENGGNG